MDERYCTECRAAIPEGESVCPACGVYAGDVFDGKLPRKRRSWSWLWWVLVILIVAAVVLFWPRPARRQAHRPIRRGPHVVKDQRDAMQTLRQFLTTSERDEQCVALMSKGKSGSDYVIAAVDRCKHVQLGSFVVEGKTARVVKR